MPLVAPSWTKGDIEPLGNEAGTAPEDRSFRPDVEGLRAVAVVLVVLYHAGISQLSGGYVGVDVFFVISGFVITGVLLRERVTSGRTSLLKFYGRRCRRIIPAATIVIVVTVVLSYVYLGVVGGNRTATDGAWTAIFLANFHFASTGTNYLTEFQAPSPLQNFWTLSVEEQFYLVYPTLFLFVGMARATVSFRLRLAIVLSAVIALSFALSVSQTANSPTGAYFSPFTRAWELALGALVAVCTPRLLRMQAQVAMVLTWVGLGCIALSAITYNAATAYPGYAVALPVVGAAFVIAGGTVVSRHGAESLLRLWPCRQLGKLSYSLYLWHWPILVLAAESAGKSSLSVSTNMLWVLVALGLSIIMYVAVENPIRHSRALRRGRFLSIGLGVGLIAMTLTIVLGELRVHTASYAPEAVPSQLMRATESPASVSAMVASASSIRAVPANLDPPLGVSVVGYEVSSPCFANTSEASVPPCLFGDPYGTRSMVVVGDSHAQMWFDTMNAIAKKSHWKLWYLAKSACPDALLPYAQGQQGGEYTSCDSWHKFVIDRINQLDPEEVVVSEENRQPPGSNTPYSNMQWRDGLVSFFRAITAPKAKFVVLGNIPMLPQTGPDCIARHTEDVQACSATVAASETPYHVAEVEAVESVGGRYIDPTPWLCSSICAPVIGDFDVYFDHYHLMGPYALHLSDVLAQALQLPASSSDHKKRGLGKTDTYLHTQVVKPNAGTVLTGFEFLDASVGDVSAVTKVEFTLTGGTLKDLPIATVTAASEVGWFGAWNSASVPNGTYRLQSVAYDQAGYVRHSADIAVTVKN